MTRVSPKHPLAEHLMKERGMIVRGWIRFNNLHVQLASNCIYNGDYHPPTVEKLREEGLYELLYPEIRTKIEEQEASKKEAVNE